MPDRSAVHRAVAVAAIGVMLCGAATFADAGRSAGHVMVSLVTMIDAARPRMFQQGGTYGARNPGDRVTRNAQPLVPKMPYGMATRAGGSV